MIDATRQEFKDLLDQQVNAFGGLVDLKLDPIIERLDRHEEKLESIVSTLDGMAKNSEHWRTESAALRAGHARHESWFQQLAQKLGIRFT